MSIQEKKQEIEELEAEESMLLAGIREDPQVCKFQKEFNAIRDKLATARAKISDMVQPRVYDIRTRITVLKNEIVVEKKCSKSRYPAIPINELPNDVFQWWKDSLRMFARSETDRWEILWISRNHQFVILKEPGFTGWSGIGDTAYEPTKFMLQEVGETILDGKIEEFEGGRMSKSRWKFLKDRACELEG